MTVRDLREKYLRFFESKGHHRFPSGSLIPYDVTGRLDESLLFNGAGMIQFKPYFRGVAKPDHPRLTTCQKCVRTGDIEEVGDDTHLTFFEMLGNFSFGDYFKEDAIRYSWEFLTSPEWLALDPARLSFTVFETDDLAEATWRSCGARHVVRLGEETNYWPAGSFSKGPPGPCGPNSEMFYWTPTDEAPPGEGYSRDEWERDESAGRWVEIWNDVFIQFEWQGEPKADGKGYNKTDLLELPFRSIDTGMGLERTAMVLSGKKSVYDTDAFTAILQTIGQLATPGSTAAHRIVADHLRTATFCISDGILPSNNGRGYVLRRIIRRAVLRASRDLGSLDDLSFSISVADTVIDVYGDFYSQLREQRTVILETLRNEERLFRRTLATGQSYLQDILNAPAQRFLENLIDRNNRLAGKEQFRVQMRVSQQDLPGIHAYLQDESGNDLIRLATLEDGFTAMRKVHAKFTANGGGFDLSTFPDARVILGDDAFRLYDTFGFPLEVTQELASEAGVEVDLEGYERALKEAQARSRGATEMETVYGGVSSDDESLPDAPTTTDFLGYDQTSAIARVVRKRKQGDKTSVALDVTPFYAESGGQVGDIGTLRFTSGGDPIWVTGTKKSGGVFWHEIAGDLPLGAEVFAQVDETRRARIRRHHTATHLLHLALRETLGNHATQAGSYVGPDRLRFDFTHGKALTEEERAKIEARVNDLALANAPVTTHVDITPDEAKAKGAMALFGEKYGDKVRMVEVGPSKELCGGTHVRTAAEIGPFRIVSEGSAQSGVRRIEAVVGEAAQETSDEDRRILRQLADRLKKPPSGLVAALERTLEQLKDERRKREKAESSSSQPSAETTAEVNGVTLVTMDLGEIDPKTAAKRVDDVAANKPFQATLAAVRADGKVQFTAKVGPEAVAKGAHAGNLLREVAKIAGGGGGGRPDFATAGGRDASKIGEALAAAESVLKAQVG
ncbi:alanine--tRNA ligase [soil metagenome]